MSMDKLISYRPTTAQLRDICAKCGNFRKGHRKMWQGHPADHRFVASLPARRSGSTRRERVRE